MDDQVESQLVQARDRTLELSQLEANHQELLGQMHGLGEQVKCLCSNVGMAIHKRSRYFVYRLPKSGSLHKPECPSFSEESDDGDEEAIVKLGFALSRFVNQITDSGLKRDRQSQNTSTSTHTKIITMQEVITRYYKESGLGYMRPEWHLVRGYRILESKVRAAVAKIPGTWAEKLCEQVVVIPKFDKAVSEEFERSLDKRLAKTGVRAKTCFIIGKVKAQIGVDEPPSFRFEQFRGAFKCVGGAKLPPVGSLVMASIKTGAKGHYEVDNTAWLSLTEDHLVTESAIESDLFEFLCSIGCVFTVNADHIGDPSRPAAWIKRVNGSVLSIFVDGKIRDGNRLNYPLQKQEIAKAV